MTFEQWWDTVAKTPAPDTFKNWEESCRQAWAAGANAERDRVCEAIKEEDDHCAAGDYMLDSDDCIKVVRGAWNRPDWDAV